MLKYATGRPLAKPRGSEICSAGPRGLYEGPRIFNDLTRMPQVSHPRGSPLLKMDCLQLSGVGIHACSSTPGANTRFPDRKFPLTPSPLGQVSKLPQVPARDAWPCATRRGVIAPSRGSSECWGRYSDFSHFHRSIGEPQAREQLRYKTHACGVASSLQMNLLPGPGREGVVGDAADAR
jgi:hypothetical protein